MMRQLLLLLALPAFAAPTLEPPAGWTDVTATRTGANLVASFSGPEKSSFVLTRIAPVALENRSAVRTLLVDVLGAVNARGGTAFTVSGNMATGSFSNGLTGHYIRADLDGRPRLILCILEFRGQTMLATIISSVPDTLLPSILGTLKDSAPAPAAARSARSSDNQLSFALPEGLAVRDLTPRERKMGFVVAIEGRGAQLMMMKLVEETPAAEQLQIVKDTVLSVAGAQSETLTDPAGLTTSAGPELVFVSVKVAGPEGGVFAAGYLPWGYFGYSVLVKGPAAAAVLSDVFQALSLGPSADARLVSASPRLPLGRRRSKLPGGRAAPWLVGAALLAAAAAGWRWRRK